MDIFTYIHDAVVMVFRDNRSDMTQYVVGCVLIFLVATGIFYVTASVCRKKEKQRAAERAQSQQKRKRAGKYPTARG